MTESALLLKKDLLQGCLSWFQVDFRQSIVSLVESQFPNYPLPAEINQVLTSWEEIRRLVEQAPSASIDLAAFFETLRATGPGNPTLFKGILLRYRRHCAAHTEALREKTFHAGLIGMLEEEITILDAVVRTGWFQEVDALRLPRAKDFLPIQYIELSEAGMSELPSRQYDEKFHILQAPSLFLPDLAYFRARCETRDAPLAVAFLDIDDFKAFNSAHGETRVDRSLLPRFMQTVEAHVYHHGFAYRQGGDEYLVLLPSFSKELAITFLDELRCKLAALHYPDIDKAPTVSIGICLAEPDCPLSDRELRDRANQAKQFAKEQGKNRLATYLGPRLTREELGIVRPAEASR